jgi:prepilin-type N-terminal cleavage/methylation domain-containing protein
MTRRNDKGFTLIELLVSVVIGTALIGALLQAIFLGLRTMDNANQRIAGANDTQLVASYFTSDVASAESISTTGTTSHAVPSVNASGANSELVAFWTLKTETLFAPPDVMNEAWDLSSTGPTPSSRISVSMADEAIGQSGATGNRVGESVAGTSSIAQSVALTPALLSTVARRPDVSTGSTAGAAELALSKPASAQAQDVMLAHIAVSGGAATTVSAPSTWTLVDSRASGTGVRSLIYRHTAAANEPLGWTWTFNGAHESAGGIAAYSGVNALNGVNAHTNDVNPCGGDTPVLLLSWTDRLGGLGPDEDHQVSYTFHSVAGENLLERRHCTDAGGTPDTTQTLARNLSPAASATAACEPVACGPLTSPVNVTVTLSEPAPLHATNGRIYQLRGTTRTNR